MRRILVLLVVVGSLLILSGPAFAAKGGIPGGKPTTTTAGPTTTTTAPEYWTCQTRIDNGATGWVLGSWDETAGHYLGQDVPSCIDILGDHVSVTDWRVEWSGSTVGDRPVKGLKLVFEEEVHGTVYAEKVVTSKTGTWEASWPATEIGNLVFVAMSHSGTKWDYLTFVVTPLN